MRGDEKRMVDAHVAWLERDGWSVRFAGLTAAANCHNSRAADFRT
jgi:hypothetical protein